MDEYEMNYNKMYFLIQMYIVSTRYKKYTSKSVLISNSWKKNNIW